MAHRVSDHTARAGSHQPETPFRLKAVLEQTSVQPGDAVQGETAHRIGTVTGRLADRLHGSVNVESSNQAAESSAPRGQACAYRMGLLLGRIREVTVHGLDPVRAKVLDGPVRRSGIQNDDRVGQRPNRIQGRGDGAHVVHACAADGQTGHGGGIGRGRIHAGESTLDGEATRSDRSVQLGHSGDRHLMDGALAELVGER